MRRNEEVPSQQAVAESSQTQPSMTKRKGIRRPTTQPKPRLRGFDDFDPDMLPKYRSPSPQPAEEEELSQAPSADQMDVDPYSQAPLTQRSQHTQHTQQSSRKRPLPYSAEGPEETAQDVMNGLLKGAAAMKKRKLEQESKKKASQVGDDEEEEAPLAPTAKRPKGRKEKELDVRSEMLKRNEEAEARVRQDEETLREALEGMDVADIRNLAQIEEMDIIRRNPPTRAAAHHDGDDDRWDDRWNGRKNFKKFRRRGDPTGVAIEQPSQRRRVIVSLEEVKKKGYGMGEEYWLESVDETRRKEKERRRETQSQRTSTANTNTNTNTDSASTQKSKSNKTQTQTQSQRQSNTTTVNIENADNDNDDPVSSADDSDRFRRRIRTSRLEDAEQERAEDLHPWEIAGTARDDSLTEKARKRPATQTQTQQARKRAAPADKEDGGAKKKVKAVPAPAPAPTTKTKAVRAASPDEDEEESDEEDAMRFRRRRK